MTPRTGQTTEGEKAVEDKDIPRPLFHHDHTVEVNGHIIGKHWRGLDRKYRVAILGFPAIVADRMYIAYRIAIRMIDDEMHIHPERWKR